MSLARENVQDYPRPPALAPVAERLLIKLGGAVVVESTRGLRVLETHHAPTYYVPPADVAALLRPAPGRTICEWKGAAAYFDVIAGDKTAARAAWSYARPTPRFAPLAGFIAFYPGPMDEAWVGDLKVMPQPGDFYGGWVTANLDGAIKGGPGTLHW